MAKFQHVRTGKIVDVAERDAHRYQNDRYKPLGAQVGVKATIVPNGTVAEVLKWAGDDNDRRAAALVVERAEKNRKGIIEALEA